MTEAAAKADFSRIRYAQVWEDADILVEALQVPAGGTCLSIASAGDNALALLAADPAKVYAIDLNPAQLHCLALRVAAFKTLDHDELLELIGSVESTQRAMLYAKCRHALETEALRFWDARPEAIAAGIGQAGKFERYFAIFRRWVIPLIHPQKRVDQLLSAKPAADRNAFYENTWGNWRWRTLFRLFFSRFMMGRLGRDPAFFNYVEGSVADRILERTRYALTRLDPSENPYLQSILRGTHQSALPFYLRPENFEKIRRNIDRIEGRLCTIESFAEQEKAIRFNAFNLSDIFEYMSESNMQTLLEQIIEMSAPGARLAYWNMLAPRSRPDALAGEIRSLPSLAEELFRQDKAFFYSRFVVEEVSPPCTR